MRGLRKSLDALRELKLLPVSHPIVLNGVEGKIGMTPHDAEKIIGAPVDVIVPRRTAVALGGNVGIPVLLSTPRDPAARAFHSLARHLDDGLTRREWRDENRARQTRPHLAARADARRPRRRPLLRKPVARTQAGRIEAGARDGAAETEAVRRRRGSPRSRQKVAQKAAEKGKWIS